MNGTAFPKRLWSLTPWKTSKPPGHTKITWACSRWLCLRRGVGPGSLQRSPLPHLNCSVMLWVLLPCEKTSLVLCPYFSVWLLNTHSTCLTSWHHAYRTIYTMKSSKQFTCHFTVRFYGCRIKLPLQADWNKSSCLWTDKVKIISSARWVWCCDFQFPSLICRLKHFPVGIVLY